MALVRPLPSEAFAADGDADARAILSANCSKCHGAAKQKGGLRFDSRDGILAKGDSGTAAVTPGKAAGSELLRRVLAKDKSERMPPEGDPLTAAQIEKLRKWIDSGAVWPKDFTPSSAGKTELVVTDEDRKHWSYRPLVKSVEGRTIDGFIRAALATKQLAPSGAADPRTLIRRVTFDLTGLPPTPDEVEEFVRVKDRDAAYERLVDRLLASPRYGERWGRHWLDVARYADSGGYESDIDRPNAYHFRDFVIKSFNNDLPFDEFVRRQLAGDEIAPSDPLAVAATGFLAAGPCESLPDFLLQEERTRQRYTELDDMVSTIGSAFLGLTVACARCHDHKFDPIPTRDYYRLMAGLHSGNRADVPLGSPAEVERNKSARADWEKQRKAADDNLRKWLDGLRSSLGHKLRAAKIDRLALSNDEKALLREKPDSSEAKALAKMHEKALAVSDDEVRKAADEPTRQRGDELAKEAAAIRSREPKALPAAMGYRDFGPKAAESWLFKRGDFHDHSTPVELGFVSVVSRGKPAADYWKEAQTAGTRKDTTYQRRAIAAWITDAEHGAGALVARVIVNRIWQHHFGEGLVRTPNDFGSRGERPTHPELLEWLAADFVSHGWSVKRLHRMILLSATYRQSSTFDAGKSKLDPDNRLLWRVRPKRLEAESLRDSILAVSGTLNFEMYGPAFRPPIPTDAMVARNLKSPYPQDIPDTSAVRRRSVYMFHKRVIPYPLLQAFDAPDAQQCAGRRALTTVVPQALAILNDPFVRSRGADFAARLQKDAGDDPAKCVDRAYALAFGRAPSEAERAAGVAFIAKQEASRRDRKLALTDYCQVLFGLNEFLYVD